MNTPLRAKPLESEKNRHRLEDVDVELAELQRPGPLNLPGRGVTPPTTQGCVCVYDK